MSEDLLGRLACALKHGQGAVTEVLRGQAELVLDEAQLLRVSRDLAELATRVDDSPPDSEELQLAIGVVLALAARRLPEVH
ncbi:MAG: hypothetical protein HRU17_09515 [Polyangiaceae bacterium]|nr:hypothetical protein [Polyangiaceae bacterium]